MILHASTTLHHVWCLPSLIWISDSLICVVCHTELTLFLNTWHLFSLSLSLFIKSLSLWAQVYFLFLFLKSTLMFKAHSLPISHVFNTERWLLSCSLYLWLEAQVNYNIIFIFVSWVSLISFIFYLRKLALYRSNVDNYLLASEIKDLYNIKTILCEEKT